MDRRGRFFCAAKKLLSKDHIDDRFVDEITPSRNELEWP